MCPMMFTFRNRICADLVIRYEATPTCETTLVWIDNNMFVLHTTSPGYSRNVYSFMFVLVL